MGLHLLRLYSDPQTQDHRGQHFVLKLNWRQVAALVFSAPGSGCPGNTGQGQAAPAHCLLGRQLSESLQLKEAVFSLIGFHQSPGLGVGGAE